MPRARKRVTCPVTSESLSKLDVHDERLLPGLSNEIVLDQMIPKLPWSAFHTLSSVSRSWRQAIQSHQVFDTRVRSHSTETLLLLNFIHSKKVESMGKGLHAICLYSAREKTWYRLPEFRHKVEIHEKTSLWLRMCSYWTVNYLCWEDKKIRILRKASGKVYVLDLAGQTGWRRYANMLDPRKNFAYGVIDGKIYVVGGYSRGECICRSDVYDPKENAWSSIRPMVSQRLDSEFERFRGPEFVTVGEKLWVYGGAFSDKNY